MQYRQLGRSGLKVSALCLGTMNFGSRTSPEESFAILSSAAEAGINFIDTADQYGGDAGVGTTETILGQWLAQDPSRRHNAVIATKVHEPMSEAVNDRGLSARHIQKACEASLRRLQVENIDLYQMHHIDRSTPIDEIWQAMDRLYQQGKITYVGSSNFPGWAIAQANERALNQQRKGLVCEQGLYNLIERRAELEVLPACQQYGVGLIPWSPLAGGLLAGGSNAPGRRQSDAVQEARRTRAEQLQGFEALCADLGETPSNVALAWLLHQPGVTATIIGPGTVDQLTNTLSVPDLMLNAETLDNIDNIFPPCGAAPEAYAW
ncbi:MAG: aldo/keto reductase [Pseudomonadota bacterium]|nr:aldo/keto reductase [Pseudomonadota bacterium]